MPCGKPSGGTMEGRGNIDAIWARIESRVEKAFDCKDALVRQCLKQWRDDAADFREYVRLSSIVHRIESDEVIEAVIDYFIAGVRERIQSFRFQTAVNERLERFALIRLKLGVVEGCLLRDTGEQRLVPEALSVVRITKSATDAACAKLIDAVMEFVCLSEYEQRHFVWPVVFGEDLAEFPQELSKFLLCQGKCGRDFVLKICKEPRVARLVRSDEDMPRPLLRLAAMVLDVGNSGAIENEWQSDFVTTQIRQ